MKTLVIRSSPVAVLVITAVSSCRWTNSFYLFVVYEGICMLIQFIPSWSWIHLYLYFFLLFFLMNLLSKCVSNETVSLNITAQYTVFYCVIMSEICLHNLFAFLTYSALKMYVTTQNNVEFDLLMWERITAWSSYSWQDESFPSFSIKYCSSCGLNCHNPFSCLLKWIGQPLRKIDRARHCSDAFQLYSLLEPWMFTVYIQYS